MTGRRAVAAASLALFAAAVVIAAVELVRDFPRGPIAVVLVGGAGLAAWHAIRRRGRMQVVALIGRRCCSSAESLSCSPASGSASGSSRQLS